VENKDLKKVYDEMHKEGSSSWFGQGEEERELILKMGEPWEDLEVLEIGCGEADLTAMIQDKGTKKSWGVDYSKSAYQKALGKWWERCSAEYTCGFNVILNDYRNIRMKFDRIVMQGVLEHLDDPFTELKWMMDNLLTEHGDVITSSPAFFNPRGFIWIALHTAGAVMSKTDLHFINGNDVEDFCKKNGYGFRFRTCDFDWACGDRMIEDLKQRIPLALKDGNIRIDRIDYLLDWLKKARNAINWEGDYGATAVYRISK
jgi:SAM-dependent methyltransferase